MKLLMEEVKTVVLNLPANDKMRAEAKVAGN
jgi:hypothetical protein